MLDKLVTPKIRRKAKQRGRGIGSGKGGHTTGSGNKGQRSRSGYDRPGPMFEGGQNPISKRVPLLKGLSKNARTRGYFSSKVKNTPVKLSRIAGLAKEGDIINLDKLLDLGLVKLRSNKELDVKVMFDKEINKKLTFEGVKVSKTALAAIEKAGGSIA